jgi:hydroxymethylpyrimidine pyrophosphatase-like HAD family hydrolase
VRTIRHWTVRYLALATDYDDTIAARGQLGDDVKAALERLRRSGRRAVLITGRILEDLLTVCPDLSDFAAVVLENGAVLHVPSRRDTQVLCPPASDALVRELARRGVTPLVQGRAILATRRPHEIAVLEAIRDLDLELQITFNRDAVMVLPSGVNKGSGLRTALRQLDLSIHEAVGVGNGQNDHSFLDLCECAVAVENAVDAVKAKADFTTSGARGAGVIQLIDELIATDLSNRVTGGVGDVVVLAQRRDGASTSTMVTFRPYGQNILICGPSGAGKSTFATGLIERLIDRDYQICIVDPEGDYGTLDVIVTMGNRLRPPHVDEVLARLGDSRANVVVNLLGIALADRPDFFAQLLPRLQAMRARTGGPDWILIDEVHHLLPEAWGQAPYTLPQRLGETILITHRPSEVAPAVLGMMDIAVAVGPSPERTLAELATALGLDPPPVPRAKRDEAIIWERSAGVDPYAAIIVPARSARLRHLRKYAEGNLGPRSFFFRGAAERMNLRAQNLTAFCELASGVDDDTWLFHLRRGDYSTWLAAAIKDGDLANEVASVEQAAQLTSSDSRRLVREAIDRRYMLPS